MTCERKIKGIAARAGHWSATHRKLAILGWLAFVVVALVIGGADRPEDARPTPTTTPASRASRRAQRSTTPASPPASEMVLVQSKEGTAGDPEFRAAVADVGRQARRRSGRQGRRESPYAAGGAISKDGHSALVEFDIRGDAEKAARTRSTRSSHRSRPPQRAHPELRIEQFGDASASKAIGGVFEEDLQKAERPSLPITLVILLIAFGALVAAGIPLLLGFSAVLATFGLVALPSQIFPVDDAAASVVLLIGMAVGVDYSLFYMRREREERAAGHTIRGRARGRGRDVGPCGAGLRPDGDGRDGRDVLLRRQGIVDRHRRDAGRRRGMVGSLTVLPAMLSWLGDRVEKGRVPLVRPAAARAARESRFWAAWSTRCCVARWSRAVAAAACWSPWRSRPSGMQTKVTGHRRLAAGPAVDEDL